MHREIAGWPPVLDGARRTAACDAAESILADLIAEPAKAGGDPFIAILFAEAAHAFERREYLAHAVTRLNSCIRMSAQAPPRIGLYKGWCGLAWVASWLRRRFPATGHGAHGQGGNFQNGPADFCTQIDSMLERLLDDWEAPTHDYDFLSGLVGIGVYALQRLPGESATRILCAVLHKLEAAAISTPEGVTWATPLASLPAHLRETAASAYYNLGVAHGVPGVVALLGYLSTVDIEAVRARRLAEGAVQWLLRQRRAAHAGGGFSHWAGSEVSSVPGRVAWCYGGLGVSAALMVAGRNLRQPEWERVAVDLALLEAARDLQHTGVVDACLCHGAAGNALIMQRFFAATGDERFRLAALQWFDTTLGLRAPGQGLGGYRFEDRGQLVDDRTFLTGSAGLALALLAGMSPAAPSWDRLLLTDIPC